MSIHNKALVVGSGVKAFRGNVVTLGVVQVTNGEFVKHLDSTYADAVICNTAFAPGQALQDVSPLLFESMKDEYQQELQLSLQSQLQAGNDVDIDFHE